MKKIRQKQTKNINKALHSACEYYKSGNLSEAEIIYREILKVQPNNSLIYNNLGAVLQQKGQLDEAMRLIQKALQLNSTYDKAYNNLGVIFRKKGQLDEALTSLQKAIQFNPLFDDAYYNLGTVFQDKGKLDEALTTFQKALQLNPNRADAYNNLGVALQKNGQFDEALTAFQKTLQLNPNHADAYNNLGVVFKDRGQLNEAEAFHRRAIQLEATNATYYNSMLFNMNYNPRNDAQTIFKEHVQFAKKVAEPLYSPITTYPNKRILNRKLRIGYLSPDFKQHAVAYFIEPILATHNREHFEIFCYSNSFIHDEVTERIQKYADQWRTIAGITDKQAAEQIRKDEIDILVDLAGHTANNKILVFARKPAPVQISWIGYPATTGLSTVDYKIVDNYTDPLGMTEQFYTETLIRLPESFLCYLPSKDSPEVGNLPVFVKGHITFGSFNNFAKVSPEIVDIWAKILGSISNSHLIIKAMSLADRSTRQYVIDMFDQKGISAERIELLSWIPSAREHLEFYKRIDVGLDTFPYNGTTTTCEAMWMGVPVITLAGPAYAARSGVSLLTNVGLPELVAITTEEYLSIAVDLANDVKRLRFLREHLRDMMTKSPLCDAKRFTANLETCYHRMWETWCGMALSP